MDGNKSMENLNYPKHDPKSMRFVAELDEENYASFFEYDEEGKLRRSKKETELGIFTISESVSELPKLKP